MNKSLIIRIVLTMLIFGIVGLVFLITLAIAASSHNVSDEIRESAIYRGYLSFGIGIVLTTLIWVPWNKINK